MDGRAYVHVQPHFFMFIHFQRVPDESPSLTIPVTSRLVLVLCVDFTLLSVSPASIVAGQSDQSISTSDLDFQNKHIEYIQATCFFLILYDVIKCT